MRAIVPILLALLPMGAAAQAAGAEPEPAKVAAAEPEPSTRGGLQLQLGVQSWLLAAGDYSISVAGEDLRASTGVGVGLLAELLDVDLFGAGLTFAVLRRPSDDRSLSDTLLFHLGVQAGPRFLVTHGLLLGVSGLLGLHVLSFRDAEETSVGLGAGGAGLVEVRMTEAVWLYAQLGVLAQPSGGHDATDVTFAPTPLAMIGFSALLPPR
jgi:hypothetical protein